MRQSQTETTSSQKDPSSGSGACERQHMKRRHCNGGSESMKRNATHEPSEPNTRQVDNVRLESGREREVWRWWPITLLELEYRGGRNGEPCMRAILAQDNATEAQSETSSHEDLNANASRSSIQFKTEAQTCCFRCVCF